MEMERVIRISGDTVRSYHNDGLVFEHHGDLSIHRATDVNYDNARGGWVVKLLRGFPAEAIEKSKAKVFKSRQGALDFELGLIKQYLKEEDYNVEDFRSCC